MRRGQAAIEFLSTYGWALVVLVLMIGTLAYFGVMDTARFAPSNCFIEAGLHCADYRLNATTLTFSFQNSFTKDLNDVNITISTRDGNCNESIYIGFLQHSSSTGLIDFCSGTSFPESIRGDIIISHSFEGERVIHSTLGDFSLHKEE